MENHRTTVHVMETPKGEKKRDREIAETIITRNFPKINVKHQKHISGCSGNMEQDRNKN
jgi:hypothetical protein